MNSLQRSWARERKYPKPWRPALQHLSPTSAIKWTPAQCLPQPTLSCGTLWSLFPQASGKYPGGYTALSKAVLLLFCFLKNGVINIWEAFTVNQALLVWCLSLESTPNLMTTTKYPIPQITWRLKALLISRSSLRPTWLFLSHHSVLSRV